MTTYTITAELLQELISNCMASIAEGGISDARRVYRTELHHRANLAMRNLQPNTQEPVAYEFRMRADWVPDWGLWSPCNKEQHEMYLHAPKLHDWIYETRALYAHPAPQKQKPLTVQEVEQILAQHNYELHGDRARYIVRMVEQAHGVKP